MSSNILIIDAHLDLMMDLSWVHQINPLTIPMMANLWIHFLVFQLNKMLEDMHVFQYLDNRRTQT